MEGAPYPFTPVNIQRRLHSKFYQKLACPLIWLRVLRKIHQALVVCPDLDGGRIVLPAIQKLWAGCSTPLHLALPPQEGYGGPGDALRQEARKVLAAMEAEGCTVEVKEVADWSSGGPAPAMFKDYGLVAVRPAPGGEKRRYPLAVAGPGEKPDDAGAVLSPAAIPGDGFFRLRTEHA